MRKERYLYTISGLLAASLIVPVYYVSSMLTEGIIFRSIIKDIMNEKSAMEYFNFIGLEAVLHQKFNDVNYTIYAFADSTKGIAGISRNDTKKLAVDNMDIYNVHGTARNDITQDVYQFEGKLMTISETHNIVRLHQDFNIKLKTSKKSSILEMRGDNIAVNTRNNTVYSTSPVIFHAEDAILVGGNFTFEDNTARMKGDIFLDSPVAIITSETLHVSFDANQSVTNGSEIFFNKATFSGKATLFDKVNNTHVSADRIIVDYKKKLAILEGNAKIKRIDGTASGSVLVYNLSSGITKLHGNFNERVKLIITY